MFWHWLRCYNVNNNSSRDKTFYVVKNMFTVGGHDHGTHYQCVFLLKNIICV